jgi:hypothetical protein
MMVAIAAFPFCPRSHKREESADLFFVFRFRGQELKSHTLHNYTTRLMTGFECPWQDETLPQGKTFIGFEWPRRPAAAIYFVITPALFPRLPQSGGR